MSPPDAAPSPDRPPKSQARSEPSRRERRALRWGLALSVGVHVVLLVVYPFLMNRLTPELGPTEREEREWTERPMEIVLLRELPELEMEEAPEPERDPELEPEPEPEPPEPDAEPDPVVVDPTVVETPPPVTDPDEDPAEVDRRTIMERLYPDPADPRLWMGVEAELTEFERAEILLHGMIRSWNDSMAVAAALQRDALDWTYTDDEGRRWGLSPGRLHLGDFSIPLPFSFDVPQGRRDQWLQRQWIYSDIERGALQAEMRETWAERAQEIRRRMDEERERRRGGGGGP